MDAPLELLDAIYRPTVLGPDRQGRRRGLSLALSGAVFLALGGLTFWVGPGAPPPPSVRAFTTVTVDLSEGAGDPPPPPLAPPGPAVVFPEVRPGDAPTLSEPTALPPGLPNAPEGQPGGTPGGLPGGLPGGVAGGTPGGQGDSSTAGPVLLPPRFDAAYLKNPEPDYPALSRRFREEGRVVLRVLVSESGTSSQLEIRDSSGHPRLDQAALEAVRRWRFSPARRGAEPVSAWVLVPLTFSLDA
jgi:protein TonB